MMSMSSLRKEKDTVAEKKGGSEGCGVQNPSDLAQQIQSRSPGRLDFISHNSCAEVFQASS